MKTTIISGALLCMLAAPAFAKTFDLPADNPAATVDLPDSWKPEEVDHGVQASSLDNESYISVETGTSKSVDKLIEDDFAYLTKTAGLTIDDKSQETSDTTMNGMAVSVMRWKAKDKEGPNAATIRIFAISDNLIVLVTQTSTPTGDTSNALAVEKILNSIKKTK